MLLLVQTSELREQGLGGLGRFLPSEKNIRLGFYPLSLIGRGRTLLNNPSVRRSVSEYRLSNPPPTHHHERSSLILGSDNKFYISPIHLAHREYPLEDNNPGAIQRAIGSVNRKDHMLGHILFKEDPFEARMFAFSASDGQTTNEIRNLEEEGLLQEALESLLLSPQAIAYIKSNDDDLREILRQ